MLLVVIIFINQTVILTILLLSIFFNLAFTQAVIKEKDETKKAELLKVYFGETLPNSIKMFDKLLKGNGGGKFFVGKGVSD